MSSTIPTSSPIEGSRPFFVRSKTMPAFKRALSIPSVDKSLASLRKSSSKGLRRMSTFRSPSKVIPSAASSTESVPTFTTPDYTQPTSSSPPVASDISPTTKPSFKRAMTMPAAALAKIPGLRKTCEREPSSRRSSISSVDSVSTLASTSTTSRRRSSVSSTTSSRRRSSVCSVESFSSTEDRMTLGLRLWAFPSTLLGCITSIIAVILIHLLPAMAPELPKRKPASRPYEREIILTEEQELNPPKLPSSTFSSRLSRSLSMAYRRALRRAARARRASSPHEALAALFAPTPKRVRATKPAPVDPKTLVSDVPLTAYTSPIALPLPKGPAPTVRPARKARRTFSLRLPTLEEGVVMDEALCAGW